MFNELLFQEERQKRMRAADDSSDEDVDGLRNEDASRWRLTSISGDDLGDSFTADEEKNTKLGWINDMLGKHADEVESEEGTSEGSESGEDDEEETDDDDDSDEDCKKTVSLKDWEQSDDDKFDTDLEVEGGRTGDGETKFDDDDEDDDDEGDEDDDDHVLEGHKESTTVKQKQTNLLDPDNVKTVSKQALNQVEDLPYTIEAPKSLEELSLLLKDRSEGQIVEAIRRIRTFNAISVAAENRKKMQVCAFIFLLI